MNINFDENKTVITKIATVKSDFKEKFGVPRQSGRAPSVISEIVFENEYAVKEAFCGIENFSHLWVIFGFSLTKEEGFSPTVRPPRLGGNKRMGVFATRSPNRPNKIGLSSGKLISVDLSGGVKLKVSGLDLVDGTPVYDIKPYIKYSDCHSDAISGFADEFQRYSLNVTIPDNLKSLLPEEKAEALAECLADDPRPSYQSDPERIYKMSFADFTIGFKVKEDELTVISIEKLSLKT